MLLYLCNDNHNDGVQDERERVLLPLRKHSNFYSNMRNLFPWVFFSSFHLGWIKEFGVRRSLHRELSKRCTHSSTAESYSDLSLFFFFTTCTIFPGFCFCHVGFTSLFSSPLFLSSSTSFTIPLLHL